MNKQILRRRIKAAGQIQKVTKAMSNVSGRKLSITETILINCREYHSEILELVSEASMSVQENNYQHTPTGNNKLAIIIATDKGLVGGLNRELTAFLKNTIPGVTHSILIGARAKRILLPKQIINIHSFSDLSDYPKPEMVAPIATLALSLYEKGVVDEVSIYHQNFESATKHSTVETKILPLHFNQGKKISAYQFDLPAESMLVNLIKEYVVATLYFAIISAKTAEHAARILAMQTASDNAAEMKESLQRLSFKNNQRAITSEIADTINARYALSV